MPLPLEIYEIIVSHVPDHLPTLISLCLTSRALAQCGQQRLYESFRTDRWHNVHANPTRFLDTILRNTHLAYHVRELVTPCRDSCEPQTLTAALPLMTNLKSFTIFAFSAASIELILRTLVDCSFQLVELRWNWVIKNPGPFHADLMTRFISHQTRLRSLSLKMTPIPFPPKNALTSLKALSTTCENIQIILPGRCIETLDCVYLDADDPDFDNMSPDSPLATPFETIKRLCLGIGSLWFRNMEKYLPSLDVLQTSIITVREYNLIASSLPHLRIIHITREASSTEQVTMSKWLFSALRGLEYVIWGSPFTARSPLAQPRYHCWSHESFKPIILDARQVHEQTGLLLLDRLLPTPSD
ncbi:hypothetical protein AGABI1DRAFT_130829 [Agaricus bisporus var. burnettii JB137-S8]|uniref:F-box domain-containing protein n=1 Tax=Agaricus bisporus var. burnettii (strain JB137-S8 / ATCC MYA-4627 / FGSC 10392) TaxID=597362 RepID=K5WP79_AGABU|nr:uncharacterized protein AGABI1DRAFT_130829 [Agaricus bisporus var. burnettii JB137-S8]EKM77106.1 hypothetical protein AGABI1DRAFT_130829 [Agaricus bisporus var. burnettii JB137-S8]